MSDSEKEAEEGAISTESTKTDGFFARDSEGKVHINTSLKKVAIGRAEGKADDGYHRFGCSTCTVTGTYQEMLQPPGFHDPVPLD